MIVEIAKHARSTNGQFVRWGKGWSRGYTTEIVQTRQTFFRKYKYIEINQIKHLIYLADQEIFNCTLIIQCTIRDIYVIYFSGRMHIHCINYEIKRAKQLNNNVFLIISSSDFQLE